MCEEKCYIIREREFIRLNENVYKIGKTKQYGENRLSTYPKNSEKILMVVVQDCDLFEKKIIASFDKKFIKLKKYGNEYYEGNIEQMVEEFYKLYVEVEKEICIKNINFKNNATSKLVNNNNDNNKTLNEIILSYNKFDDDTKKKFIDIFDKNKFVLEHSDICKYVDVLSNKKFIYVKNNDIYNIYCYNGKIWKNDDILMKHFLSNDLYDFFKMILLKFYFDHHLFNQMKNKIEKLKNISYKKDIVESYKEVGTKNELKFDDKWYLFGFNNCVYDLVEEKMREYKYDDYVSTTTGYDWREPTEDEIKTINKLIDQIMPVQEEKELYLQILATTLDGKCLEKFIVFNGSGGNGKGMMNDLLLIALGNYGLIGNNAILFETNKSGSNPEKANIHKKRLVIFREPPEKNKFENSVVKELTGGGFFSSRGHHESTTKKELNLTMIVECNKKPLFSEEPGQSEVRRLIDLFFRTTYTHDKTLVNEKNNIYLANSYYKESEFQEKHKYALLKILMDSYKKYKNNDYTWTLPKTIEERTSLYLQMSCNIVTWFKENYELTEKKDDICKIKDLYEHFTSSMYFSNLLKVEKKNTINHIFKIMLKIIFFLKNIIVKDPVKLEIIFMDGFKKTIMMIKYAISRTIKSLISRLILNIFLNSFYF
jgi:hypothetical protein